MSDLYPKPIDAALAYAGFGWRVAPVSPGSKVPAIKEWQKAATTDEATILGWWAAPSSPHTDAGVCIVTGKETGLWVLDVDVADGKQGLETLRELVGQNGPLGETLVARTPSGGYHYYFSYPADVEIHNSASNRLGPGLDVRGEGGQVNAPPTQRGDSGYRWADGRAPWSAEVQPAPAWLVELVKDRERPSLAVVHGVAEAREVSQQLHALDAVPSFVTEYNRVTTWEEMLTAEGWTPCHSEGDIDYWARPGKDCHEGISGSTNYADSDLLYVWSTSIEGLPSDRAYDRYGYMVHTKHGGNFTEAARKFSAARKQDDAKGEDLRSELITKPIVGDIAGRPLGLGLLADDQSSNAALDGDPSTNDAPDESKFAAALMPLWSADFWDADPTAKDFLIEPFLARGRAHALYASAKAGKSYIALQAIAAACVPGHDSWASVPAPLVKVLYLDYEMTEDDLRERLSIFGYGAADDYSNLHYVKASLLGADLDTKDGGRELLDQARAWGVDLVVVDTMSRAVSGDENDADTVRKFYQHTGRLLKAHDIAWLRIDHAGKDSEKGQRGSSAKNDDVDIVWRLERLDAGARLTRTHSRVFWIPDEILLANVAHADGSVHHERTVSIEAIAGLGAKAQEWVNRRIPAKASKRELREDYGFEFKDADFGRIRDKAAEIYDLESLAVPGVVPSDFDGNRGNRGVAEGGSPPGSLYREPGEPLDAGNVPADSADAAEEVRRLQREFGITDDEGTA